MIHLSVLASSSKGNATVLSDGDTHLMIDAGISALRIRRGLEECGLSVNQLSGIFLTHEHTDHTCGLGVLSRKDSLRLYCSRYLCRDLSKAAPHAALTCIEPGSKIQVGTFNITPFSVSHDALDPMGFLVECGGARLGYITDTGRIPSGVSSLLRQVDALYVESNYDPDMLRNSDRSRSLIERISGTWGHLSNQQASSFVQELVHPGLQHVILGHLSQECNTPDLAFQSMNEVLSRAGVHTRLHVASPNQRLPWIDIRSPF